MIKNAAALPALAYLLAATSLADPSLELRVGSSEAFQPGATIGVSLDAAGTLDLRLNKARAEIDLKSIEIHLNGTSIAGFARVNRMLRGLRVIVDRRTQDHPDLALRDQNPLMFGCEDALGNFYRGQFVLRVSQAESEPRLLAAPSPDTPKVLVAGAGHNEGPYVSLNVRDVHRGQRTARLVAEIRDKQGIREVLIGVNWREVERIVMHNGLPSRRRGELRSSRSLPGSVMGDSVDLRLDMPIPLQKRETSVSTRATNVAGSVTSEVVQVQRER